MWKTSFKICLIISLAAACFLVWDKAYDLFQEFKAANAHGIGSVTKALIDDMEELTSAIRAGDLGKVQILVKAGQDINAIDDNGNSALDTIRSLLYSGYEEKKHIDIIDYLLDQGLDASIKDEIGDATLLHDAAHYGHYSVVDSLYKHGYDMNAIDNEGKSLMMWLLKVQSGDSEELTTMIDFLIERKADPNFKDTLGFTILTYANLSDKIKLTEHFRASGLEGDIQNKEEAQNALNKLGINNEDEFAKAVTYANFGLARVFLLADYNSNVKSSDDHPVLISLIASEGYEEMIEFMLSHGANPNTMDDHESTALFTATLLNKPDIVRIMLKYGADDLPNKSGYTALMSAREDGYTEIVSMLENAQNTEYLQEKEEEKNLEENEYVDDNENNSEPLSYSKQKMIIDFVGEYINEGLNAINKDDFSYVELYLDPNSKAYQQSKESIQEAGLTGKSLELVSYEGTQVSPINDYTYSVKTYEEYEITYASGSVDRNGYNSEYIVVIRPLDNLAINETKNVEKVSTERIIEVN